MCAQRDRRCVEAEMGCEGMCVCRWGGSGRCWEYVEGQTCYGSVCVCVETELFVCLCPHVERLDFVWRRVMYVCVQ